MSDSEQPQEERLDPKEAMRQALERKKQKEHFSASHGVDAERGEVIEMGGDAGQIADAIIAAVLERAGIDLIDHRATPPILIHLHIPCECLARGLCPRPEGSALRGLWRAAMGGGARGR